MCCTCVYIHVHEACSEEYTSKYISLKTALLSRVILLFSFVPGMAGQAHHCHEAHLGSGLRSS